VTGKSAVLLICLLLAPMVCSAGGDITFFLPKDEYYFLTGEQAVIPLNMSNSYDSNIGGTLGYSITQESNTGSMHFSNSRSGSQSLTIPAGDSVISLNFGSSNDPETLTVSLDFNYDDDGGRIVSLDNILIHFVEEEPDSEQSEPMQSSSEEASSSSTQQATDPFTQQQEEMQRMMEQMFNQQSSPQNSRQAMQNNQMDQDTAALKEQMEQQMQKQQAMQEEFRQQVASDQDFRNATRNLSEMGYNMTDFSSNPSSNESGTFSATYENQNGETASIQGEMENGTMKSMQVDSAEDRQGLRDILAQNEDYRKYAEQLEEDNFTETNATFSRNGNTTDLQINYENPEGEQARIDAEFVNDTVESVELTRDEENNPYPLYLLILLAGLGLAYMAYRKYSTGRPEEPAIEEIPQPAEVFDYKTEAGKLLDRAVLLYEEKRVKDAYGTAAQALRLYLGCRHGLSREVTNAELLEYLKAKRIKAEEAERCLRLCSMVEFAKYVPEDDEFGEMTAVIGDIMHMKRWEGRGEEKAAELEDSGELEGV
jgi:hypothetical protein